MNDPFVIAALIGIAFTLAGFVKGVLGMGLPTVAMGLLGLLMPPAAAAAMLIVPSFVTNIWQLFAGPKFLVLLRRLAGMMLMVLVGVALSFRVLTGDSSALASAALGVILALYGVVGLVARKFTVSRRAERWLSPLVGLITGLITGATGIFVIPVVPYITSLELARDELIQALGIAFTISTIALGTALVVSGKFQFASAGGSLLAVIPALAGMAIGQRLRSKLEPAVFRRWFFVGLIMLGLYMFGKAVI